MVDGADLGVERARIGDAAGALVARAVVHHHDLEAAAEAAPERNGAVEQRADVVFFVEDGEHEGQLGRGHRCGT